MIDVIVFLTSLAIILLGGIISLVIAKRAKLPLPLLLFIVGIIFGNIMYAGRPLIELNGTLLSVFSIIALLVVMFESTSKVKLYDFDKYAKDSLWFFAVTLIINLTAMSYLSRFLFNLDWFVAIIFALLISCIEFNAIFPRYHLPNNKIKQLLKFESDVSCAFILVIPFIIMLFLQTVTIPFQSNVFSQIIGFAAIVFAGVGAGVVVSLIAFNAMRNRYLEKFSPLIIAAAVLVAYLVAKNIEGSGIVAAATIGLIFGNIFLKQKGEIEKRLHSVYSILEVLIFIIVGVVVGLQWSVDFFKFSFMLFLVYILIRFIAAQLILRKHDVEERIELAFFVPKGLATVTVAFALLNYTFTGSALLVQLLLIFFVYSLIFDTILDKVGFYTHRQS